jgi:hypothetical protein
MGMNALSDLILCLPLRKFQGCDRGSALKILDCLSGASFQNLAQPTEQTGPEGEIFVGAPFFWILFLGVQEKHPGLGAEPRSFFKTFF